MHRVLRLAPWLAALCLAGALCAARPLAAQSLQPDHDNRTAPPATDRVAGLTQLPAEGATDAGQSTFSGGLQVVYPAGDELIASEAVALARSTPGAPEFARVLFYLQASDDTGQAPGGTLMELGEDGDGSDDWSVPLRIEDLNPQVSYRLVVFGATADGQVVSAQGGWFGVWPQHSNAPWVQVPVQSPLRGNSLMAALLGDVDALPAYLAYYLSPLPQSQGEALSQYHLAAGMSYFLGAVELAPGSGPVTNRWQYLHFDTRLLPDGDYLATVASTIEDPANSGAAAGQGAVLAGVPVSIRNDVLPQIQIIAPDVAEAVRDTLSLSAIASEDLGTIQRIDFMLEYAQPTLPGAEPLDEPDGSLARLYWLGSDVDGSDGWGISASVEPFCDGDNWYAWAVAVDAQGHTQSVRSAHPLTILQSDRPHVRLLRPSGQRLLRGVERITATADPQYPLADRIVAYLQDESGQLHLLGQLQADGQFWYLDWPTANHPDGRYRLWLVAADAAGNEATITGPLLTLRNQQGFYRFRLPASDATLSGENLVEVLPVTDSPDIAALAVDCRDQNGTLWPVGQDDSADGGWLLAWPTSRYPDGEYTLLAQVTAVDGSTSLISDTVHIRNVTPSIVLQSPEAGSHWASSHQIVWQAEHPQGAPLAVTIEYSPDGGHLWLQVATALAGQNTFRWDTSAYPDGAQCLLRLTASGGGGEARVVSEPFTVDNVNDTPGVTLLSPTAGTLDDTTVAVTWEAWDPDDDPLTIDLDYRLGDGDWEPMAHGLPNNGAYRWQPHDLAFGQDYSIRVTATDPAGAADFDVVRPLRFHENHAPTIELLWPKNRIHVDQETVILWKAIDDDDDALSIDIYYSDNAGQAWLPLAEGLDNSGYYVWQVSFLPTGGQYRVRVVAHDGLSTAAAESDGVFLVGQSAPPQVTVFSPDPLVPLRGLQMVRWSAISPSGSALQAEVQVRATRYGHWETLTTQPAETGCYLWDTSIFADGEYELRVVARPVSAADAATSDVSSENVAMQAIATLPEPVTVDNSVPTTLSVDLLAPRGGELWSGLHEILWETSSPGTTPLTATLSLSDDGGASWQEIATLPAQAGRYVWDADTVGAASPVLLRVQVRDAAGDTATAVSPGPVHLAQGDLPPHVFITLPSVGVPDEPAVAWDAQDPNDDALTVSLALSADDGRTWETLETGLPATGRYTLTTATNSQATYRAKATASDGIYRVSAESAAFQGHVTAEDSLLQLSFEEMNQDATWSRTMPIRWSARYDGHESVAIDLAASDNGGQSWTTIARNLDNSGVYAWDTSTTANGVYLLQVMAHTAQASRTIVTSEPITVFNYGGHAPTISVVSPRGGEVWSGPQEIRWRADDQDGDALTFSLAYSVDRGANWKVLADGIQDADSYIWDTSTIPNCAEVWLRAMATDGRFRAYASTIGPFTVHNGHVPWITLLRPTQGGAVTGTCEVAWHATAEPDSLTRVTIEISADQGKTWEAVASGLPASGTYRWVLADTAEEEVMLRAIASDGHTKGIDTLWQPLRLCRGG